MRERRSRVGVAGPGITYHGGTRPWRRRRSHPPGERRRSRPPGQRRRSHPPGQRPPVSDPGPASRIVAELDLVDLPCGPRNRSTRSAARGGGTRRVARIEQFGGVAEILADVERRARGKRTAGPHPPHPTEARPGIPAVLRGGAPAARADLDPAAKFNFERGRT